MPFGNLGRLLNRGYQLYKDSSIVPRADLSGAYGSSPLPNPTPATTPTPTVQPSGSRVAGLQAGVDYGNFGQAPAWTQQASQNTIRDIAKIANNFVPQQEEQYQQQTPSYDYSQRHIYGAPSVQNISFNFPEIKSTPSLAEKLIGGDSKATPISFDRFERPEWDPVDPFQPSPGTPPPETFARDQSRYEKLLGYKYGEGGGEYAESV